MLVNDNFDKPLNHQLREMKFLGSYLFTSGSSFRPNKSGWYKIIVVGGGGDSRVVSQYDRCEIGASGGVVISTRKLSPSVSYSIVVTTINSIFTYNESDIMKATRGSNYASGIGGTAEGGDYQYNGLNGFSQTRGNTEGQNVGVYIPGISEKAISVGGDVTDGMATVNSGYGILGYGASPGASANPTVVGTSRDTGCVLIVPLELEQ